MPILLTNPDPPPRLWQIKVNESIFFALLEMARKEVSVPVPDGVSGQQLEGVDKGNFLHLIPSDIICTVQQLLCLMGDIWGLLIHHPDLSTLTEAEVDLLITTVKRKGEVLCALYQFVLDKDLAPSFLDYKVLWLYYRRHIQHAQFIGVDIPLYTMYEACFEAHHSVTRKLPLARAKSSRNATDQIAGVRTRLAKLASESLSRYNGSFLTDFDQSSHKPLPLLEVAKSLKIKELDVQIMGTASYPPFLWPSTGGGDGSGHDAEQDRGSLANDCSCCCEEDQGRACSNDDQELFPCQGSAAGENGIAATCHRWSHPNCMMMVSEGSNLDPTKWMCRDCAAAAVERAVSVGDDDDNGLAEEAGSGVGAGATSLFEMEGDDRDGTSGRYPQWRGGDDAEDGEICLWDEDSNRNQVTVDAGVDVNVAYQTICHELQVMAQENRLDEAHHVSREPLSCTAEPLVLRNIGTINHSRAGVRNAKGRITFKEAWGEGVFTVTFELNDRPTRLRVKLAWIQSVEITPDTDGAGASGYYGALAMALTQPPLLEERHLQWKKGDPVSSGSLSRRKTNKYRWTRLYHQPEGSHIDPRWREITLAFEKLAGKTAFGPMEGWQTFAKDLDSATGFPVRLNQPLAASALAGQGGDALQLSVPLFAAQEVREKHDDEGVTVHDRDRKNHFIAVAPRIAAVYARTTRWVLQQTSSGGLMANASDKDFTSMLVTARRLCRELV